MDNLIAAELQTLEDRWRDSGLQPWLEQLPQQMARGFSTTRYGDLPRWTEALAALPEITPEAVQLDAARVGCSGTLDPVEREQLLSALQGLHPWRKGPFQLFDVHIDTEWRSDWKWDRLRDAVADLAGKRVLDVGCGSGYHCWRMLGAGAAEVIGIDPSPLFNVQFRAIQHFLRQPSINVLPVALEQLPGQLKTFDTTFSMGVLYHRRSPMDHLTELRETLVPGGQLVLETLVVEGGADTVFVPPGRYARMGNVWFLPSPSALCVWLAKAGFLNVRLVDVSQTGTDEQRTTDWMTFHSLAQFLDPGDPQQTVEGHPAPRRAILTADASE